MTHSKTAMTHPLNCPAASTHAGLISRNLISQETAPTHPPTHSCNLGMGAHLSVGFHLAAERLLHGSHSGQLFFQCLHALPAAHLVLLQHPSSAVQSVIMTYNGGIQQNNSDLVSTTLPCVAAIMV